MATLSADLAASNGQLIETHTAWVFVGNETVWKVKKPVDYGFLDYSTLEKRLAACEAEVRLNARLAPDVYQGVDPITKDERGHHAVSGRGEIVDYAVRMRRLAEECRADLLLAANSLRRNDVERVACHIAAFHGRMPAGETIGRFGAPELVLANVRENFSQTRGTIREFLSESEAAEIEAKQVRFLEDNGKLFLARVREGRVRDGHGDLRLEHVYLSSGRPPTIIDCIEFNDRFRYADVCSDLAFLSMDLERFGRADLAEHLLACYARASGDYELYRLVDFYEGYRAYVRGKVAAILSSDTGADAGTRERAQRDARHAYVLSLSEGRARIIGPAVIAVGGVIASGKSTIAESISAMTSAPIIDADHTRKRLLGVEATAHIDDAAWTGAYASEVTARTYDELLRCADSVLASGRPVILDASFRSRSLRDRARAFAREHGMPFYFVECRAPLDECRRRLEKRAQGQSISDGRLEIFDAFVAGWEAVDELSSKEHIIVETSLSLEANERRLRDLVPAWPKGLTR